MEAFTFLLLFPVPCRNWCLIFITAIILSIIFISYQTFSAIRYPSNLPLANEPAGKRRFSWRTRWRYYTDCESLYKEAYDKYTKHGKTVLLPGLGFRHDIVMPQSAMRWVLAHPEKELSHVDAVLELVQLKYALGDGKYKADPWPCMLIKSEINSELEAVCQGLKEELKQAFDEYLGRDQEFCHEVDLLGTIRMVVARAASRFTVGFPLCHNEEYLRDCWRVIDGMVVNGGLTGATPRILRPIIGPLVTWNLRRNIKRIKNHLEPIYRQRLQVLCERSHGAGFNDKESSSTQDLFQKMLQYAQRERPDEIYDLDSMTKRLCFANFAAMHQTSLLVTNVLLNILGSDSEFNTISALRDEVGRIIGTEDGAKWTKYKVAQMVKSDSVARETLRLNSNTNRGIFRKVLVEGIKTDDGIELPKGAFISFLARPLQCNPETFDDPFQYDPFRFSRTREATVATAKGKHASINLNFVSTSPEHLPFGHGNHSCPGRFLVDFEMKMIISYVLMNYDIEFPAEYGGKRPANRWMAEALAPPPGARIKVKRRSGPSWPQRVIVA